MQEFDWQEDAEDLDMDWELQEDEDSELLQEFDDVTEEDIRQMRDDEEDEADDLPDEELDP